MAGSNDWTNSLNPCFYLLLHVGGQRKRYKDSLKAYLKDFNIDVATWETAASNRPAWRNRVS